MPCFKTLNSRVSKIFDGPPSNSKTVKLPLPRGAGKKLDFLRVVVTFMFILFILGVGMVNWRTLASSIWHTLRQVTVHFLDLCYLIQLMTG